jgi:hypothetical protein
MAQGSQQFTPAQILEAGRRAEIEGRVDFAVQFYRHLMDHMPRTPEASVAEQALLRLAVQAAPGAPAGGGAANGLYQGAKPVPDGAGPSMAATYSVPASARAGAAVRNIGPPPPEPEETARRKLAVPRSRRRYRTGRFVARMFTFLGFFEIGGGALILCMVAVTQAGVTLPGLLSLIDGQTPLIAIAVGVVLILVGAGVVLGGQLARALFDQASATRDLAALSRPRAAVNTGVQKSAAAANI